MLDSDYALHISLVKRLYALVGFAQAGDCKVADPECQRQYDAETAH
jgi:hypothetical protein